MVSVSRLTGRMAGVRAQVVSAASAGPLVTPKPAPKVVIIGGGIAGVSAAVVLAERGIPVVVAEADLGAEMLAELRALWPETARLCPVDQHGRVGADAASFPIGAHGITPGVGTRVPGLTLAGDWVAAPFPSALMERSAATGILAANTIVAAGGCVTEPVWPVPPRGMLAGRRSRASGYSLAGPADPA